jgi:hypothetical protein
MSGNKKNSGQHRLIHPQRGNSFNILLTSSQKRSHISTPNKNNSAHGNRSNFKAELVRNELLARNDLMKLYQPPLKKH